MGMTSNFEDFKKLTAVIDKTPIALNSTELQVIYLSFIAKYLAQIADALNGIKEDKDGNIT
jgi:hypothetical protein